MFHEIRDLIYTNQLMLIVQVNPVKSKKLLEGDIFSALIDQLIKTNMKALEEHFSAFIREWINSGCVLNHGWK